VACIAMDGTIHPLSEEMNDHPNGRCGAVPVTRWNEGETPVRRVKDEETGEYEIIQATGEQWFEGLSDEQKEGIMGGAAFRAYKDGKVDLNDLFTMEHSATFGTEPRRRSLSDILGEDAQEYYVHKEGE